MEAIHHKKIYLSIHTSAFKVIASLGFIKDIGLVRAYGYQDFTEIQPPPRGGEAGTCKPYRLVHFWEWQVGLYYGESTPQVVQFAR